MSQEFFGALSGAFVIFSAIPYLIATYRDNRPHLTSWLLWTFIGLAMLLTYQGSGAGWNIIPAIFGATNPLLISLLILWKGGEIDPLEKSDKACIVLCAISMAGWVWYAYYGDPEYASYALLLAIAADGAAAWPTIKKVYRDPMSDKPVSWLLFSFAWGINFLALPNWHWSSWILPAWLTAGSLIIAVPLIRYRQKHKIPFSWSWAI